jgi:hypothetical protein
MADQLNVERAELDADDIMALLLLVWFDLHPVYANTSYRGRGIGGQAITQQCSVVSPEGWEYAALMYIETAISAYAQQHPDQRALAKKGQLMEKIKEFEREHLTKPKENESNGD